MPAFKIKKKFVDSDRREYVAGNTIELESRMKIDRMIYYGIIGNEPIDPIFLNLKKAISVLSGKPFKFNILNPTKKKRGRPSKRQKEFEKAVTQ